MLYIAPMPHNIHVYIMAAMKKKEQRRKKKGLYTLTLDPGVADLWMKGAFGPEIDRPDFTISCP